MKRTWTDIFLCRSEFRAKIRQSLSDELSSLKRKTSDMLFSSLGFNYLLSRCVAYSKQQYTSSSVEDLRANAKLLRTGASGELVFSRWRCAKTEEFANVTSRTPSMTVVLTIRMVTLSYFPARCLFSSLVSLWGNCRRLSLSLEPCSNLFKGEFWHQRSHMPLFPQR